MLAAYLAEERERLKPDAYDLYAQVIGLLQASLDGYAHSSLEDDEREPWEKRLNADDDRRIGGEWVLVETWSVYP